MRIKFFMDYEFPKVLSMSKALDLRWSQFFRHISRSGCPDADTNVGTCQISLIELCYENN